MTRRNSVSYRTTAYLFLLETNELKSALVDFDGNPVKTGLVDGWFKSQFS
ncbi:MAG TPA: hypothetical protein VEH56_05935 [Candidatus Saccharimonadales bacterium]|nr:hypothetical protein [Candidatus Saccharimonadales bacterium]